MTFKQIAAAGAAVAALAANSAAFAQAQPAAARPAAAPAAAAPAVTQGPAIPGLCTVSVEAAIGGSTVGQYVGTRMQQLGTQANAELNGEKTAIDNDAKALEGQRATLDQNTLEQRASALQVRFNALQRKAEQRDRELQATQQKALGRVATEMDPVLRQIYQTQKCSLLIERGAVIIPNPSMDITQPVVTAMNAKITQFAFDRERLDQAPQGGAPAPAAAAPRAAAPAAPARK
jgi:Skp family chaperone for outer membrane proteins